MPPQRPPVYTLNGGPMKLFLKLLMNRTPWTAGLNPVNRAVADAEAGGQAGAAGGAAAATGARVAGALAVAGTQTAVTGAPGSSAGGCAAGEVTGEGIAAGAIATTPTGARVMAVAGAASSVSVQVVSAEAREPLRCATTLKT